MTWNNSDGVYTGRVTMARLWLAGSSLSEGWRLLILFLEQCGLLTTLFGGAQQMTAAMTLDEANQLGMRYVQVLNQQGNPGVGLLPFDYSEWVRYNRGAPPPMFAELLQGRTITA